LLRPAKHGAKEKQQGGDKCQKNHDKCIAACTTHFNEHERFYCFINCDSIMHECYNPPKDKDSKRPTQPKNQQTPGNVQVPPKLPSKTGVGRPPDGGILQQGNPVFTPSRPSAIGTRAPN
jgi:hypothetical protein